MDKFFHKNLYLLVPLFFISIFITHVYAQYIYPKSENSQDSAGYYFQKDIKFFIEKDSLNKAERFLDYNEKRAIDKGDNTCLMQIYFQRAKLDHKKNLFNKSLLLYKNVLKLSKAANDTNLTIKSLSAVSDLYKELSIADSAFIYCEREMILNKAINNYAGVSDNFRRLYSITRYTIGGISHSKFIISGLLDSSLVWAKKSKRPGAVVFAMANIAGYAHGGDPEEKLELTKASIDSARKMPVPNEALVYALLQSYNNFWRAGQFQEAEDNLLEALPMALVFNKSSWIGHIYWLLGEIEKSKANKDKALNYLRKAVYYCEKGNVSPLKRSIYSSIRDVYKELGNIDSTLYFLEKYSRLTQKAHNIAMNKQISLLSAKFKVAEKEGKIELLDELNRQKEEKIYLQNLFILTLAASVIIVSILLIFSFSQYKKTQKAYLILTRKNAEIQKQQKEIVKLNGEKRANIKSKLEPQKMKLVDLFENDKVYLDKNLSLKTVASLLDTNTSYLSTLINSVYKCNFTQFVHKYRVLEACEILSNEKNEIYIMEVIAEMSGFVSKSAFNKAFKEITGLTPSNFRKNIKANENYSE